MLEVIITTSWQHRCSWDTLKTMGVELGVLMVHGIYSEPSLKGLSELRTQYKKPPY